MVPKCIHAHTMKRGDIYVCLPKRGLTKMRNPRGFFFFYKMFVDQDQAVENVQIEL